jgi:hypothetical protein
MAESPYQLAVTFLGRYEDLLEMLSAGAEEAVL